ncbi:protein transport protein YOS1 [Westerdykella ornata]|uniref:Protein transport protein YOS1 n=1 Tax=Westerdykella ornata TaxID=318751 RepID=A0A6A6JNC9_WESOR|nr:protein transport protein YOS1 [Westerdykella ornata]KAF2278121.1 protein transport protein YOS1 [Westerdykella ornata]
MVFFGLGGLLYVSILLINAIAVLSEDRFLARIGWTSSAAADPGFGAPRDDASVKARLVQFVSSVRTLMRIPLMFINTILIVYLLVLG